MLLDHWIYHLTYTHIMINHLETLKLITTKTITVTVTVGQYTGGKIACDGLTKFSTSFAEDYCWTQGIYTIKEAYDIKDNSLPYPGILDGFMVHF